MLLPRLCYRLFLLLPALCANLAQERAVPPPTSLPGKAADLVRAWWSEGTAAGNVGDFYENRDRGHRNFDLKVFPQMQKMQFTTNELAMMVDFGSPRTIRTNVLMANSSTAAQVIDGGSNTRLLYSRPHMVAFAYEMYVRNNLHAFPEHMDHDPGHNGNPGWGDVFPLNTPYVYTSQGSSGSELPFMEAAALTLAAFRPEVKAKLVQKGLLLPTLQMLLRRSYQPAPEPADYLTGRAHPTVFESKLIDPAAMVRGAHSITLETLPPIAKVRVVEEDHPRQNSDFFDAARSEQLCDTPGAIGRIFRGLQRTRRMVVSADGSFDQNLAPMTWHWAVLRGDTNRIQIKPLNPRGSIVEINVAYHERRPIFPGAEIESNRIDIGCFVNNGTFYSAPAFICFFFPDNEARGYNEAGKILDAGYNAGTTTVDIVNWRGLFDILKQNGARAQFIQSRISESDWNTMLAAEENYDALVALEKEAILARKAIRQRVDKLEAQENQLRKDPSKNSAELAALKREVEPERERDRVAAAKLTEASKALKDHLAGSRAILEPLLSNWVANLSFVYTERHDLERLYKAADARARREFDRGRELLTYYGLLGPASGFDFPLTPARAKPAPLDDRLTPFERCLVQRLNGAVISLFILRDAVESVFHENYADPALTAKKDWRDVYHYDPAGKLTGWTRHTPGMPRAEFNEAGECVEKGKAIKIRYDARAETVNKRRIVKMQWSRTE